jgi:hypothetical protein
MATHERRLHVTTQGDRSTNAYLDATRHQSTLEPLAPQGKDNKRICLGPMLDGTCATVARRQG